MARKSSQPFVAPRGEDGKFIPRDQWPKKVQKEFERLRKEGVFKGVQKNPIVKSSSGRRKGKNIWIPPHDRSGRFLPMSQWSETDKKAYRRALRVGLVPGGLVPRGYAGRFAADTTSRSRRHKKAQSTAIQVRPTDALAGAEDQDLFDIRRTIRRIEHRVEDLVFGLDDVRYDLKSADRQRSRIRTEVEGREDEAIESMPTKRYREPEKPGLVARTLDSIRRRVGSKRRRKTIVVVPQDREGVEEEWDTIYPEGEYGDFDDSYMPRGFEEDRDDRQIEMFVSPHECAECREAILGAASTIGDSCRKKVSSTTPEECVECENAIIAAAHRVGESCRRVGRLADEPYGPCGPSRGGKIVRNNTSRAMMYNRPRVLGQRFDEVLGYIKKHPVVAIVGIGALALIGFALYKMIRTILSNVVFGASIRRGIMSFPGSNPYMITQDDSLWLIRAIWGEVNRSDQHWETPGVQQGSAAVLWALANNYMTVGRKRELYPTFGQYIQAYCQPINPIWSSAGASGCQRNPAACTADRLAFRQALRSKPWNQFPAGAQALVTAFVDGTLRNPIGRRTDWAAAGAGRTAADAVNIADNIFLTDPSARSRTATT